MYKRGKKNIPILKYILTGGYNDDDLFIFIFFCRLRIINLMNG